MNFFIGEVKVEEYGEEFVKKWFGSRGLVIYFFLKEMDLKVDLFGLENKLIIIFGLLIGMSVFIGGRYNVVMKSL